MVYISGLNVYWPTLLQYFSSISKYKKYRYDNLFPHNRLFQVYPQYFSSYIDTYTKAIKFEQMLLLET